MSPEPAQRPVPALAPLIAALAVAVCAVAVPQACGSAQHPGGVSAAIQCRLDALKVLPADPLNATVYDAVDVIQRIRACKRAHPDAGVP
jgi:hypothetical protein